MNVPEPRSQPRVPAVSPAVPGRRWRALLGLLQRLPQGLLSRLTGRLADVRLPRPCRRPVLRAFARAAGIRISEAEHPLEHYESINAFFVRRLRPGVRRWPADPSVIASPVDSVLGRFGTIRHGTLIQAKARSYSCAELLGDAGAAAPFDGGTFLTLYLAPRHYHRIHAPCDGAILSARHLPGGLMPVNSPAVAHIPDLFVRNERLVCMLEAHGGRIALVAVGAYNVGRISTAFDPAWNTVHPPPGWVTNRPESVGAVHRYDPPLAVRQGEELMAFHLGSTVVLLVQPDHGRPLAGLRVGQEIRLGSELVRAEPT